MMHEKHLRENTPITALATLAPEFSMLYPVYCPLFIEGEIISYVIPKFGKYAGSFVASQSCLIVSFDFDSHTSPGHRINYSCLHAYRQQPKIISDQK